MHPRRGSVAGRKIAPDSTYKLHERRGVTTPSPRDANAPRENRQPRRARVREEDRSMEHEHDSNEHEDGFIRGLAKDDGVQRAAAGVVVAVIVAGVKRAIFGNGK